MASTPMEGHHVLTVGIIGGGIIGSGWARLLSGRGHRVKLYDSRRERVSGADSMGEAVSGADLVIEAVHEEEDLKRAVIQEVSQLAPGDALIASSSSSILPSRLQQGRSALNASWYCTPFIR